MPVDVLNHRVEELVLAVGLTVRASEPVIKVTPYCFFERNQLYKSAKSAISQIV